MSQCSIFKWLRFCIYSGVASTYFEVTFDSFEIVAETLLNSFKIFKNDSPILLFWYCSTNYTNGSLIEFWFDQNVSHSFCSNLTEVHMIQWYDFLQSFNDDNCYGGYVAWFLKVCQQKYVSSDNIHGKGNYLHQLGNYQCWQYTRFTDAGAPSGLSRTSR